MQVKKILWITFNSLPVFSEKLLGNSFPGSPWLQPLANALSKDPGIELGVVSPSTYLNIQKIKIDNITQFTVPINVKKARFFSRLYPELLKNYDKIITEFEPSLIHVHGTEKYFGLLVNYFKIPMIISIQGYITACLPHLTGNLKPKELRRHFSIKNILGKGGILNQKKNWLRYLSPMETRIIKQNRFFIGRTSWDKNHLLSINENATYFQGEELLRSTFYANEWDFNSIEQFSIFISNANYPLKGLHVVLQSLIELKDDFPKIKLKIPMNGNKFWNQNILWGNDYWRYLKSIIKKQKLEKHLDFIGFQTDDGMAKVFRQAHVFVMPSFIENSSNALGEAMITGTPCIVSNAGGLVDIIQDEVNGLVMDNGSSKSLSDKLRAIFKNPALAYKLSGNGRQTALKRHDEATTKNQYIKIYDQLIHTNSQ